jgi:hypothetical protein
VACQRGRRFEARLVYIHEGWETNGKRREIEQPLYLSSVDEDTETLWEKVWEEVDKHYDLERVERIYLMGDGAAWIQGAKTVFPQAEFVLDKFHYMKYIRKAVGGAQKQGKMLKNAIRFGNYEKAQAVIRELIKEAATPSRKLSILDAWKYIDNNWEAIKALYREEKTLSCSAEGHISHVLSARLSSRPSLTITFVISIIVPNVNNRLQSTALLFVAVLEVLFSVTSQKITLLRVVFFP